MKENVDFQEHLEYCHTSATDAPSYAHVPWVLDALGSNGDAAYSREGTRRGLKPWDDKVCLSNETYMY